MKEFADDNFKFDENGRKFSKKVENTVGKGEIARYDSVFKRLVLQTRKNQGLFWKGLNDLRYLDPKDSIETGAPVETEIVRVVSLSTTEITDIKRF